jgi:2-oxoglutarate dehydrogenase E1 component
LIVAAPKSLLRHPRCRSPLAEFDDVPDDHGIVGVRFKRLIMDDTGASPKSRAFSPPQEPEYKRIVFCSGKVFYELHAERERRLKEAAGGGGEGGGEAGATTATPEVAIVRVEQLAPFPFDLVRRELKRYPNAEVFWAQEEPMNMGAYFHVQPRLISCMRAEGRDEGAAAADGRIKYAGRPPSASTATGFGEVHAQEQARLVSDALDLSFEGTTF